jgi:hypothetical protein
MRRVERQAIESPGTDPIVLWRTSRLEEAGFTAEIAEALARDSAYDLHALLELVDRGCLPELAARILAPLDGNAQPC